jgi:Tfp pilus assembly protein PilO
MGYRIKILIIAIIFLASVALIVLFIIPNLSSSIRINAEIEEEREDNKISNEELKNLLLVRDEYYELNAAYQKYSLQLPSENDISIFTNEVYDIAKYSDVTIYSIDYVDIPVVVEEGKEPEFAIIEADLILAGPYYNIMNFIKTIEKMPRIVIIKDIIIQSTEEDYEELDAYITVQLYNKI